MIRKIIKALWIFLAVIVLAIVIVFVSISKGWIGYMPPVFKSSSQRLPLSHVVGYGINCPLSFCH